jgi:hypothetical protein
MMIGRMPRYVRKSISPRVSPLCRQNYEAQLQTPRFQSNAPPTSGETNPAARGNQDPRQLVTNNAAPAGYGSV